MIHRIEIGNFLYEVGEIFNFSLKLAKNFKNIISIYFCHMKSLHFVRLIPVSFML